MSDLFTWSDDGALFSKDRLHRYRLWRIWNKDKPLVMFVGLNPSKAKESKSDPTIDCVRKFCERWEYGGFYMMNLFSFVSPHPEDLLTCWDPIRNNDDHLKEVAALCTGGVIFAWGKFEQAQARRLAVEKMFPEALCIGKKEGHPFHPLWAGMWAPAAVKDTFTQPVKFK